MTDKKKHSSPLPSSFGRERDIGNTGWFVSNEIAGEIKQNLPLSTSSKRNDIFFLDYNVYVGFCTVLSWISIKRFQIFILCAHMDVTFDLKFWTKTYNWFVLCRCMAVCLLG